MPLVRVLYLTREMRISPEIKGSKEDGTQLGWVLPSKYRTLDTVDHVHCP